MTTAMQQLARCLVHSAYLLVTVSSWSAYCK